jgi:hypothetical protein
MYTIDYFAPLDPVTTELQRIKGEQRRLFVGRAIHEDGIHSVPEQWKAHDLPEFFKGLFGGQHPQARGGEDLPDVAPGEVEVVSCAAPNRRGSLGSFAHRLDTMDIRGNKAHR